MPSDKETPVDRLNRFPFVVPSKETNKKIRDRIDELFLRVLETTNNEEVKKCVPILQTYQSELYNRSTRKMAIASLSLIIFSIILNIVTIHYSMRDNQFDAEWYKRQELGLEEIKSGGEKSISMLKETNSHLKNANSLSQKELAEIRKYNSWLQKYFVSQNKSEVKPNSSSD